MARLEQFQTPAAETLKPGVYRHFKGGSYQLLSLARDSETDEPLVVYCCLDKPDTLWVRSLGMFTEEVSVAGRSVPRFQRIGDVPPQPKTLVGVDPH
jgi:hypothetical protein